MKREWSLVFVNSLIFLCVLCVSAVLLMRHPKNRRDAENAKEAQRVSKKAESLKVSYISKRPLSISEIRSVVIRSSIELLDPAFLHS
jgi:hypothetical protein